jgi:hypothetical protein
VKNQGYQLVVEIETTYLNDPLFLIGNLLETIALFFFLGAIQYLRGQE